MWRFCLAILLLGSTFAAACGGSSSSSSNSPAAAGSATARPSGDDKDLQSHEAELRETAIAFQKGILTAGAVKSYGYFADEFKQRCALDDFVGVLAIAKLLLGDLNENVIDVQITGVRYEDGKAFVESKATIDGSAFDGEGNNGEFPDYWVRQDGEWKITSDDPTPCDTSTTFGESTPEAKTPPATGPGTTRADAVAVGTSVRGGDAEVTVLRVDLDAQAAIAQASDFPSTPEPGKRYVLATVRVKALSSGEDTIDLSEGNFSMTGSGNRVYESYGEGTSCGFDVPNELNAKLFPGGEAEGNICLQLPRSESGLILIFEPQFSFNERDRRYLALE